MQNQLFLLISTIEKTSSFSARFRAAVQNSTIQTTACYELMRAMSNTVKKVKSGNLSKRLNRIITFNQNKISALEN